MKDQPIVSVIVPVYKVEKYLKDCVDSLRNQSFHDLEIILIDDGSPDACPKMCDAYAEEEGRIRVIHKENGGQSDARNQGIEAARGKYLVFLDSDDLALPDMCETLYNRITAEDADIAAFGFWEESGRGRRLWRTDEKDYSFSGEEALAEVLKGEKINAFFWGKIFKRELFFDPDIRFPKGRIYEDLWISPDLYLKAKKVEASAKPVCIYRYRPESAMREGYNPKTYDAVLAGKTVYEKVKKEAPRCLREAKFRLDWTYFTVLDRMLTQKDPKSLPEYREVTGYLKTRWREIAACPYFQRSRRVSAAALKLGVPFYKMLLRLHNTR